MPRARAGEADTVVAVTGGDQSPAWHALTAGDVVERLDTGRTGLPEDERARRLARHGPNTAAAEKREPWWGELLESFTEPLQLLLIAVAVLSGVFGDMVDAIAIASVVVVVAALETASEMRAARAIAALKALTAPTARLVRESGVVEVPSADLVPGDVVAVEAGDVVPADARVLSASGLRADESTLTGEAAPVGKTEHPVPAETELAERSGVLHAGTAVLAGEGRAVVVATGETTQLGRLGKLVADTKEPPTPLQLGLSQLARTVAIVAIAASVLVPVVGLLTGQPWQEMLLSGLTIAFATVPEELPILITVLLAIGGRALARRGVLLRRLRAGETLGAVTTVVTDKTGTLTENELQLAEIRGDRSRVLEVALACQSEDAAQRDPLETQLAHAAAEAGIARQGRQVATFPFDPIRKLVSRAHTTGDGIVLAVSGAPEAVLDRCRLDPATRSALDTELDALSGRGMRVVAFAQRRLDPETADRETADRDVVERELSYVGLAAFTDPIRPGLRRAVAELTDAGVATIVVTGDHPATAAAAAAQAGLPAGRTLRGQDLDVLSDADLATRLRHGSVIPRATPAAKHRVVRALQQRGEVVAVTGDGANDAPALAVADVGIVLGRRSAELARATAGVVLTDDAYPTVITAVAKGRNIGAQLRRAVAFYLGAKLALVLVLLLALALGLPGPFQPVHIVLLEIFMDLGASVAFVAEPAAPQAMRRPPRRADSRFLDRVVVTAIATTAATLTLAVLPAYLLLTELGASTEEARTGAVLTWLTAHALIAWTLRSQPALSWTANPAFPAWAVTALLAGLAATLTPVAAVLDFAPLTWGGAAIVATLVVAATAAAAAANRATRLPQLL